MHVFLPLMTLWFGVQETCLQCLSKQVSKHCREQSWHAEAEPAEGLVHGELILHVQSKQFVSDEQVRASEQEVQTLHHIKS